jgi:hypothetical protein
VRSDVVLNPGGAAFGSVRVGEVAEKKLTVNYAGRSDWKILGARSTNPHIDVEVKETRRYHGRVDYELLVRLKEAMPVGYFTDLVLLVTNDARAKRVPVTVEGNIVAPLTVSPVSLCLGIVKPGETVTKQLLVRGAQPFKITHVKCEDDRFAFQPSADSKKLHLVPVTFTAALDSGNVVQRIEIETDMGSGVVAGCTAIATVRDPNGDG